MNREKVLEALKAAQVNDDTEAAHSDADDVLCDLLISLGYQDVVDEWRAVHKWYA